MKAIRVTAPAILLAVLWSAAAATDDDRAVQGRFERTLPVTGTVSLNVETGSGNISVSRGTGGSAHVVGRIRARGWGAAEKVRRLEADPPIVQSGNSMRIGKIEDETLRRNVSISYEIQVPADTRLQAGTGSGDVMVEGILGPANAGTGSGNVRFSDIEGEAEATTGSGDVVLDALDSGVRATTGSGNIHGKGLRGKLVLHTGSGDVMVEQSTPEDVQVQTGSGNVSIAGVTGRLTAETGSGDLIVEGRPEGAWRLSAGSGNLRLALPRSVGYELDAQTSSGEIRVDAPIVLQGAANRRRVRGTVGSGGVSISAETGSGDIVVESR
ncbi:MAG: DUF4097 domain-containing protein [Acidobacteria bacterium]|nr:DUF4097 domain-containing protein [Acidobacteriota bacterium]